MAPNPFDYFAIQNTIARYCIALDNKNFDLLSDIFAADVHATFPVLGAEPIKDVATLARIIQTRSSRIVTHQRGRQLMTMLDSVP